MLAGYPLELDVHLSSDGAVVVFHDDDLQRMTGVSGPIGEFPWAELRGLELADSDQMIPRLEDVLDLVDGRVPLLVEIKNRGPVGRLEDAVQSVLGSYDGPWAVQSFNPFTLAWFRKNAPHAIRGQLSTDFWGTQLAVYKKVLLRRLALHPLAQPSFVGYDLRCLPFWATSWLRNRGIPLLAWTIRSDDECIRARSVADNIIFEHIRPGVNM